MLRDHTVAVDNKCVIAWLGRTYVLNGIIFVNTGTVFYLFSIQVYESQVKMFYQLQRISQGKLFPPLGDSNREKYASLFCAATLKMLLSTGTDQHVPAT